MKKRSYIKGTLKNNPNIPFYFIGINISSSVRKLEAALVGVSGPDIGAEIFLYKSIAFDLPPEIIKTFEDFKISLSSDKKSCGGNVQDSKTLNASFKLSEETQKSSLISLSELRVMLTLVLEEAVSELLSETGITRSAIVTITVNSPDVKINSPLWEEQNCIFSLVDSSSLAQKSGINVIDSLNFVDGVTLKHSILKLPYWVLLGNNEKGKLVVDLGETARWFYLPSAQVDSDSWKHIQYDEVCACGSLLNLLTKNTTKGETDLDVGGKLSVQGQCVSELLSYWQSDQDHEFMSGNTNSSCGALEEGYLVDKLLSFNSKVSSIDVLCTAVHWIADSIIQSVKKNHWYENKDSYDVVLIGAARQNGLLFNRLLMNFEARTIHSLHEYGDFVEDSFDSIAVSLLGVFWGMGRSFVWDNTNLERKQQVGRLTLSGSVESWDLLMNYQKAIRL